MNLSDHPYFLDREGKTFLSPEGAKALSEGTKIADDWYILFEDVENPIYVHRDQQTREVAVIKVPEWFDRVFGYAHLKSETLQAISKPFYCQALRILSLPENFQREQALNWLVISKDCAVRCYLIGQNGSGQKSPS